MVCALSRSGDGKFIAAKAGQELAIWDFPKKKLAKAIPVQGEFDMAGFGPKAARLGLWSPDGRLFISASRDVKFKILNGQSFETLREIKANYTPDKVQWSPGGKLVATTADERILAWEADTGRELPLPQTLTYRINDFCWAGDSKRILISNMDEVAMVEVPSNI